MKNQPYFINMRNPPTNHVSHSQMKHTRKVLLSLTLRLKPNSLVYFSAKRTASANAASMSGSSVNSGTT